MENYKDFMPAKPIAGHRGFYPCKPNEWRDLPLPLCCGTSYPVNGRYITAVVFEAWFDNYKFSAKVEVHPHNAFKALFCSSEGDTQLYTVCSVKWADGSYSGAKWWSDNQTGAFSIAIGGGYTVLKQGGFQGHLPGNCYKDEDGEWTLRQTEQSATFYCLV